MKEDNNQKQSASFERVSEVLRNRLSFSSSRMHIINEEEEHSASKKQKDEAFFDNDDSSSDYLFGDDVPPTKHNKKKPQLHKDISERLSQVLEIEQPQKYLPIKRTESRALSESFNENKKAGKTKTKYKKSDNVGNEMLFQKKIDTIFKFICEPNRTITVNSLGHALQKYKVNFEVKDVVDMLKLYSNMTNSNGEQEQLQDEDEQNLDLQAKMKEQQFRQLYKIIRKKPRK